MRMWNGVSVWPSPVVSVACDRDHRRRRRSHVACASHPPRHGATDIDRIHRTVVDAAHTASASCAAAGMADSRPDPPEAASSGGSRHSSENHPASGTAASSWDGADCRRSAVVVVVGVARGHRCGHSNHDCEKSRDGHCHDDDQRRQGR